MLSSLISTAVIAQGAHTLNTWLNLLMMYEFVCKNVQCVLLRLYHTFASYLYCWNSSVAHAYSSSIIASFEKPSCHSSSLPVSAAGVSVAQRGLLFVQLVHVHVLFRHGEGQTAPLVGEHRVPARGIAV